LLDSEQKKQWPNALAAALLLSFTLFFFCPLQIYLTNTLEFTFRFPGLLGLLFLLALASSLLLGLMLFPFSTRSILRQRAQALIFALGLLLWLQGNILVWRYGPLDGRLINWNGKIILGLIDGAIWLIVLVFFQIKCKSLLPRMRSLASYILLLQLLVLGYLVLRRPPEPNYLKYEFDIDKRYDYSQHKNVIILLLDNFQSDLFAEIAGEDSAIRETFSGFTYFRNNLGGFPVTYASVPLILTGKYYDNSLPIQSFIKQSFMSPSSLPRVLSEHGMNVALFPASQNIVYSDPKLAANVVPRPYWFMLSDVGGLLDVSLFRSLPHFAKRLVYNGQNWFLKNILPAQPFPGPAIRSAPPGSAAPAKRGRRKSRLFKNPWHIGNRNFFPRASSHFKDVDFVYGTVNKAEKSVAAPVFKFFHWLGVHDPFQMNERLEAEAMPATRGNWKRLARGELALVHVFLKTLKHLEVFDDALIIIMGDHGHPRGIYGRILPPDLASRENTPLQVDAGIMAAATPLLLVKRPGKGGELRTSDAPVSVADIAKTIFSELQIDTACPGESIFAVPETAARPRLYYYYTWTINDWKTEYLPPLREFRVSGHSWLNSSWQATGRVLRRP
jgi:hypothetical protein